MQFEHACLDFWELQQLDYVQGFRCTCQNSSQFLTADGLAMGHHFDKCHIVAPFAGAASFAASVCVCASGCTSPAHLQNECNAKPACSCNLSLLCYAALDSAPLQYGSVFADRTFVRSRTARELLRRFSSSSGVNSGLSEAEFHKLQDSFEDSSSAAHSLLPFLTSTSVDPDRLLAAEQHRQLLKCLACPDSVDTILPKAAHVAARELVHAKRLSLASQQLLQQVSPVLHGFVRPHLSSVAVPDSVCSLITQLLKVRSLCNSMCASCFAPCRLNVCTSLLSVN